MRNYALLAMVTLFLAVGFGTHVVFASNLTSANITSDGSVIGTLSGATLITAGVPGTMHTLNVTNVTTDNGTALPSGQYKFYLQANSTQQATLTNYFIAKNWSNSAYTTQIDKEIAGTSPFFYFVSDGSGNYGLEDGFHDAGWRSCHIDRNADGAINVYAQERIPHGDSWH